mgnify:CR=1 FL=1
MVYLGYGLYLVKFYNRDQEVMCSTLTFHNGAMRVGCRALDLKLVVYNKIQKIIISIKVL